MSSVMKSTVSNNSKEMSAFSDYPPPAHFPIFMPHERVCEYLTLYAQKFDLIRHVRFNSNVLQVYKAIDHDSTGRWEVQFKDKDNNFAYETFDAVMVCTGHCAYPNVPQFYGLDHFQGTVLHSQNYKTSSGFEDSSVVVVGIGNSGVDIAVELSRIAKKVYLSTGRGSWITYRVDHRGTPHDVAHITRFQSCYLLSIFGAAIANKFLETQANWRFDHDRFGLKPSHGFLAQHPTVSDELPNRVLTGTLIIKDDVDYFTERGVCFDQDTVVYDVDAVVLATGYTIKFPFLNKDVTGLDHSRMNLYKYVFPPHEGPSTLAIVGLVQSSCSVFPMSEIQCRWAARVFTGKCRLPPPSVMLSDIAKRREMLQSRYGASTRHAVQVDYIDYCDQISEIIGAKPNLWRILTTNVILFHLCVFGPCFPYQYRLNGPHCWSGAADAILNAKNRLFGSLQTRQPAGLFRRRTLLHLLLAPLWALLAFVLVLLFSTS